MSLPVAVGGAPAGGGDKQLVHPADRLATSFQYVLF